jgi:hypothetical protein
VIRMAEDPLFRHLQSRIVSGGIIRVCRPYAIGNRGRTRSAFDTHPGSRPNCYPDVHAGVKRPGWSTVHGWFGAAVHIGAWQALTQ